MSASQHFFLVIEGLDGTGKSEVSRHLARMLRETMGDRVLLTFEPHDPSAAGLFIRQALSRRIKTSSRALALAYALNRVDHNERAIQPFLDAEGARVVICDRYYLSSLVYQSSAAQPMEAVLALNAAARRPDLTLFLSASARTCYERIRARAGDRELFDDNLAAMRARYDEAIAFLRARGETIIEVSAEGDLPTVLNRAIDALREHAPPWLDMQRILLAESHPDLDSDFDARIDYLGMIAALTADLLPIPDKRSLKSALNELKRRVTAEIERMSAAQLGALLLLELESAGYQRGGRLPWRDAIAYALEFPLPAVGLMQRGVLLLMPVSGRYGAITRKLQEIADENADLGLLADFAIVLDPAPLQSPPIFQYRRDFSPRLFPNTRIVGRADLLAYLWSTVSSHFINSLDQPLHAAAQALVMAL
jgi:dTMP kinase